MKFLVSYYPLTMNSLGKEAIRRFGLPPYADHSCRREPDLESEFPSITALCRGSNFAPRLNVSDVAVYMTIKGNYPGHPGRHRRLTAILKVIERFQSHEMAAAWYEDMGLELPRNCIVPDNPPLDLDRTSNLDNYPHVERWDSEYRRRSEECSVFLVCEPLFLELYAPPVVTEDMLCAAFGRIPGTRNPPSIPDVEYHSFVELVGLPQILRQVALKSDSSPRRRPKSPS